MVTAMRSKALLSKSARLKTRRGADTHRVDTLPMRVADLGAGELVAHCDCCGRHFQLYPGHADFDAKTRLVSLLDRLACGARRNGDTCGGLPRRLILRRDDRSWVLDSSGTWIEEHSQFWERGDFEALQGRSQAVF